MIRNISRVRWLACANLLWLLCSLPGCAGGMRGDLAVGPQPKPTPTTRDLALGNGATLKLEISGLTSADLTRFGLALTPDARFAPATSGPVLLPSPPDVPRSPAGVEIPTVLRSPEARRAWLMVQARAARDRGDAAGEVAYLAAYNETVAPTGGAR